MKKSDILNKIVEFYTSGNKSKFAKMLGVAPQTVSAWFARDTFDAELITTKCREINPHFLLTGDGPMLQGTHSKTDKNEPKSETDLILEELRSIRNDIKNDLQEMRQLHAETSQLLFNAIRIYEESKEFERVQRVNSTYQDIAGLHAHAISRAAELINENKKDDVL